MFKTSLTIMVLWCGVGAFNSKADNITMNPGFESASFAGWTLSGTHSSPGDEGLYYGVDTADAHTGRYGAYFGPVGGMLNLSQTLSTIPGTLYSVSFWLAQAPATSFPYVNSFAISFGGTTLLSQTAVPPGAYTEYSFVQLASSTSTTLAFAFRNDVGFFSLDDVSVAANSVPEPASWLLVASVLGGFFVARRCI